ncbi:hypothetical protein MTR62_07100 [Novosphingobium sp. 1949]|uniref:Core-binding (CB) domain-containing protein n=1 Tax=Novosphingobium organovorum TaxID=2930092 RepID=A0ABT0BC64_9SPHN|nr:hypothetical protein [Novosphingobium organovorum]MCJ2182463.1 hypothetical protein [Novosphingobium organovorum]
MTHVRRSSDGGFEVRIVVPPDLRSTVGKANLTKRLGRLSMLEANRRAAPVICYFQRVLEQARAGGDDVGSPAQTALPMSRGQARPIHSSTPLMDLFDGYVRERRPAPSTIKRWRPVMAHLVSYLGHDRSDRVSADDIIGLKEALAGQRVGGRTIREVYLASAKVVFAWAVENRKLLENPVAGISVRVPKRQRVRAPSFTSAEWIDFAICIPWRWDGSANVRIEPLRKLGAIHIIKALPTHAAMGINRASGLALKSMSLWVQISPK